MFIKKGVVDMEKHIRTLLQILIELLIAFGILMIIQSQIMTLTKVYQWSMYDTLSEGDLLITEKITYRFRKPERGDVAIVLAQREKGLEGSRLGILLEDYKKVIKDEEPRTRYVKRVIGVPGDLITMTNGKVYVNEKLLEEDYTIGETKSHSLVDSVVVPEGSVFVLGDNRERSLDSRSFGCVPIRNLESRVWIKVWPHLEGIKH